MADVKDLILGYREFYKKYFTSGNVLYKELARVGQSPKTLIVACSDSRADPSIITSANPGDIFVLRNVANLVPPYEDSETGLHGVSAALEFAVRILEVNNIIILGHSNCSGIQTLINPDKLKKTDFVGSWVNVAAPAKEKTAERLKGSPDKTQFQHICEEESVLLSLDNLLTFPWIKSNVENNKLKLYGWHFSLEDGHLSEYSPEEGKFEKIPT